MKITRASDPVKTNRGSADWFTGTVHIDPIASNPAPETVQAARVSFEAGARTHWHTHPHGQVLHILSGVARLQSKGGPVQEAYPGETVTFDPDEEHWHGASAERSMVHLAIQRSDATSNAVTWLKPVTDAEYVKKG